MLAVTLAAVWVVMEIDLSQLLQISPWIVVTLVVLTVLFMLNHGLGVCMILWGMGADTGYLRTYHVITGAAAASYLGNLQLSVPLRVYLLNRLLHVPLGVGAGAVGIEALLWIAMMGLIVALPVSEIWGEMAWIPSILALAGCAAGGLALYVFPSYGAHLPDRIWRFSTEGLKNAVRELEQGVRSVRPGNLCAAAACFSINYGIDALSLYLLLSELGFSVNPMYLLYVIVLSYLAGTLSFIPMGIGTRDISFIALLSQLGPSIETATVAAVLQRILRSFIPLVLSAVSLNVLGIRHLESLKLQSESSTSQGA